MVRFLWEGFCNIFINICCEFLIKVFFWDVYIVIKYCSKGIILYFLYIIRYLFLGEKEEVDSELLILGGFCF